MDENRPPEYNLTLLCVEDNPVNLRLIERILAQRPSVQLITAMQGRRALELAHQHRPDLVLLDVHLPDIDGDEVLRRLRTDPGTRAIPVVVVSAEATPAKIERFLAAGALAYLTKPINVRQLLEVVDGIAAGRAGGAAAAAVTPDDGDEGALDKRVIAELRELYTAQGDQLADLIALFFEEGTRHLAGLRNAAAADDAAAVKRLAHALKGDSASLAVRPLAELCGRLEQLAASGTLAGIDELLAAIEAEFQLARAALRDEFPPQT
jgi:CheY-like chemotaxis protein/HPt (histidine-containing phosphotransfer) domain-containing protein